MKHSLILQELERLESKLRRVLRIVETGTIRSLEANYKKGDGHSTYYIAEWMINRGYNHEFISIDLETSIAFNYFFVERCIPDLKNFTLVKGDSLKVLPGIENVDFYYLDSANDADLILEEFKIAYSKLKQGTIVIDDCDQQQTEKKKGLKVIPYVQENNYEYKIQQGRLIVYK